ncbi:MAG: PKD domain-containing protein [Chloroflexi bacterium]|nr:MAG: PKD domain-containing protein [Chloroflexota bacterium]
MMRFKHRQTRHYLASCALLLALLTGALLSPASPVHAEPPDLDLPRGFEQEAVANGLTKPTSFAFAPDGRIFVAEKAGFVRVIDGNGLQVQPWLDISGKVNSFFDRGLDGIAVDPNWPRAPYIYLAYSYDPPEAKVHNPEGARVSRVVRVTATGNLNVGDPGSEVVLVGTNSRFEFIGNPDKGDSAPYTCQNGDGSYVRDCVPNEGNSHMISQIGFGPDGALYISSGDGINYNYANLRAQSVDSLAGKILRVNPANGNGYANNPFYNGDPGSNRSKVFALGLRNPWRFTFQPGTGSLFVADVGNNKWEEINRVPAGANLGWPCFEGRVENAFDPECQPTLSGAWPVTHGVYVYPHAKNRGAAIGGDFVRGNNFPAAFRGAYFYGDFNSATIDYLLFDQQGGATSHVFTAPAFAAVQMTFGRDGALYLLYHFNGTLARIRYTGVENSPPVAVAQANVTSGPPPLAVQFVGSNSHDPDGDRLTLLWDFGDGQSSGDHNPVHTYSTAGVYRANLTVSDLNAARSQSIEIRVGEGAPVATIDAPGNGSHYAMGDRVNFRGQASDPQDGALTGGALKWSVFLHHNEHIHSDYFTASGSSGSFAYDDHGDGVYLELCLTATDSSGLSSQNCVNLLPKETTLTFQSQPSGLPLSYAGSSYTTPFRVRTYQNAERTIEAPPTAQGGLRFAGWSDVGGARHSVRVAGEATYTATYIDPNGAIPAQAAAGAGDGAVVNSSSPAVTAPSTNSQSSGQSAGQSAGQGAGQHSGNGRILTEGAPEGGARLLLRAASQFNERWAAVQWKNDKGQWQTVDGWQGAVVNGYQRWWIGPDLYNAGPFRWAILDGEAGNLLAASEPFNLPEAEDKMRVWEVP